MKIQGIYRSTGFLFVLLSCETIESKYDQSIISGY